MGAKIQLNHAGREYLHFPVTGLPLGPLNAMEIRFPPATVWVAMQWVSYIAGVWVLWDGVTGVPTHARILVAGSDVNAGGGVVLAAASTVIPELRLVSDPEVIVRTSLAAIVVSSA